MRDSSSTAAPRILIADDQADVLEALRLLLKGEGYQIDAVTSPAAVIAALEARDFDVVIMDLNYTRDTTSGQEGLDLLTRIHGIDSVLPVIVMTAWATVGLAVEAMRGGARDFVQKPWENERLLTIVKTQIDLSNALRRGLRLEAENRLLRAEGVPTLDRGVASHAAGAADDLARGAIGCERADHRRAGHGQGSGGAKLCSRFRRAAPSRW